MDPVIARTDPELIEVARGERPAELLLTGARVVNVFTRTIEAADVAMYKGRFAAVGKVGPAERRLDLSGRFIAPGFIDAHMHVESTMLLPGEFVRAAAPHGTTGVVLDPHEIANVLGIAGIRFLMHLADRLPMHIMFAASSCVPSSPLETAGATLNAEDLRPLFDDPRVVALAEMMNFPGVVSADPGICAKVQLGLERAVVDGHAPGLGGPGLQAYVAAGISSDHECTTAEEALEKLALGMRIYIREGSAARNLDALLPAVTPRNAHRFSFCTDDRHPGDLVEQGHIDHVVRRAIGEGLDPATAIAMASLHTAEHYGRTDLGAVAPGRLADCIVFDDLTDLRASSVYCAGCEIARDGRCVATIEAPAASTIGRASVRLPALAPDCLRVSATRAGAHIRVIGMDPHQLVTEHLVLPPEIEDGAYVSDLARDVLKLAVIERHKASGNIGIGFVQGFGLQRGAIASTVGHDAHNLAVVGTNDADMLTAANALAKCGGGQSAACDGESIGVLPLPIGGLMSDQPFERVVEQQRALLDAVRRLGCTIHDPFMPLSFLPLTVIPSLKLSDLGLVDVDRFEFTTLEVPAS